MIGPFGGINQEAISALPRRFQLLRCRQRARGHQIEMDQGILQNRRELMQVFVRFRPRHRKLRAQDITGGIRFVIGEDTLQLLRHGWQFPLGPAARVTPARAGCAPFCIRVLLGGPGDITEDGQQRVEWGLGQTGQSFPRAIVSDVQPYR
jgi:hypothetical protein